jgi:ubiquinone/menaquinone biosynthesis C-methylase UbiE
LEHDFTPIQRFQKNVEYYAKYRPRYPEKILSILKERGILYSSMVIADIGSGTGILSKLFLDKGYKVIGVEPQEQMRLYAEKYLSNYNKFVSVDARAENTSLFPHSIDLITVGQAFHWFNLNIDKVKEEFIRVLKPNGHVLLAWNRSNTERPRYGQFLKKYASDYEQVRDLQYQIDYDGFFQSYESIQIPNSHYHDFEEFKGLTLSSSYMQDKLSPEMISELQAIFDELSCKGQIEIDYITHIYLGKI